MSPKHNKTSSSKGILGRVKDVSEPEREKMKRQLNAQSARRYRERKKEDEARLQQAFDRNEEQMVRLEKIVLDLSAQIKGPEPQHCGESSGNGNKRK